MIPIREIIDENVYDHKDAPFLLGQGFSEKSGRQVICQACRNGGLPSVFYMRRYCFTGKDFKAWAKNI